MEDWAYAQHDVSEELTRLHFFSMKKRQTEGDIEFLITVREYVEPPYPGMRFFAQTDRETNQKTAPFRPCGWGRTLYDSVSECMNAIRRFRYEGPEAAVRSSGA